MEKERQLSWRARLALPCLILSLTTSLSALDRDVVVDSVPRGATVRVDGRLLSVVTPTPPFELDWKRSSVYTIEVALDGYESQTLRLNYDQAKAIKEKPWRLPAFQLQAVRLAVPVEISAPIQGAQVQINGRPAGVTPLSTNALAVAIIAARLPFMSWAPRP